MAHETALEQLVPGGTTKNIVEYPSQQVESFGKVILEVEAVDKVHEPIAETLVVPQHRTVEYVVAVSIHQDQMPQKRISHGFDEHDVECTSSGDGVKVVEAMQRVGSDMLVSQASESCVEQSADFPVHEDVEEGKQMDDIPVPPQMEERVGSKVLSRSAYPNASR